MSLQNYRKELNGRVSVLEENFKNFKEECSKLIDEINEQRSKITEEYSESKENIDDLVLNIEKADQNSKAALEDIEEIKSKTTDLYEELKQISEEVSGEGSSSILSDIKDSQSTITETYNKIINIEEHIFGAIKEQREAISLQEYTQLDKEHTESKDGKYFKITSQKIVGVKEKIEQTLSECRNIKEQELRRISERDEEAKLKNDEIYNKITKLLPGATAAGLTVAYETAKTEAKKQIWLWSTFFGVALAGLVTVSYFLIGYGAISFEPNITFEKASVQVFRVLGFGFPFIWLAWAANIKVSQYSRLYEEYRHKWTVTRAFEGMQKAIENSEDENGNTNITSFYSAVLDTYSSNPSKTLDKTYLPDGPMSLFADLKGNMQNRLKNPTKERD